MKSTIKTSKIMSQFKIIPLVFAVSSLMLSACTTTETVSKTKNNLYAGSGDALLDFDNLNELSELLEATNMDMVENNQADILRMGNLWDRLRRGFRMDHNVDGNGRIEAQKSWFISRQSYLDSLTARASRYFYYTVLEAERRNIPTELALLPIIESSYDPVATSSAAAAGLWQFIPSTGRGYGLSISSEYDGRRDVIESTNAAYEFLTKLHNRFGSWELALAAYNAGPTRIQNAIDRNREQGLDVDYWSLDLPTETMNYVPRFLAVSEIVANPQIHNVSLPAMANKQHFRIVPASTGMSLSEVSEITGINEVELQWLNPGLSLKKIVASSPQRIVIPDSVPMSVDSKITKGLTNNFNYPSNLMASLADNNLSNYNSEPYNNLALPSSSAELAKYAQNANVALSSPDKYTDYGVDSAYSFEEITVSENTSELFNILNVKRDTIDTGSFKENLQDWNINTISSDSKNIDTNNITGLVTEEMSDVSADKVVTKTYVDKDKMNKAQVSNHNVKVVKAVTVKPVVDTKSKTNKNITSNDQKYTIKAGDTLLGVANKFGIKASSIASANNLTVTSNLLIGNILNIPDDTDTSKSVLSQKPSVITKSITKQPAKSNNTIETMSYKIKSGDTLSGIADSLGVSISDISGLNNFLNDYRVKLNEKIKVPKTTFKPSTVDVAKAVNVKSNNASQVYKIKPGDTLLGIANRFNISASDLAVANGLQVTSDVFIGNEITIAVNNPNNNSTNKISSAKKTNIETEEYVVVSGDSLIALAAKSNSTLSVIATLNGLKMTDQLRIGQKIKLPKKTVIYKVESGDSLIGLARKYGLSTKSLADMNGIATDTLLKRGQKITVPNN